MFWEVTRRGALLIANRARTRAVLTSRGTGGGRWFRQGVIRPQGPHTDAQTCCTHGGTGVIAEFEIRKSRSPTITRHQRTRISSTRTAAMNASMDTARQPRSPRTSHTVTIDNATYYAKRTMGDRCKEMDPVPLAFTRSVQPQVRGPNRCSVTGA